MKLFLIYRTEIVGYDEYDSAVVVAADEESAKKIHPREEYANKEWWKEDMEYNSWVIPEKVNVSYLGICESGDYKEGSVVCASFNAG